MLSSLPTVSQTTDLFAHEEILTKSNILKVLVDVVVKQPGGADHFRPVAEALRHHQGARHAGNHLESIQLTICFPN